MHEEVLVIKKHIRRITNLKLEVILVLYCEIISFPVMPIYSVAPIKALCSERFEDWNMKFGPLGLKCMELTGDSEIEDYYELQEVNIILTTPVGSC